MTELINICLEDILRYNIGVRTVTGVVPEQAGEVAQEREAVPRQPVSRIRSSLPLPPLASLGRRQASGEIQKLFFFKFQ